MGRNKVLIVDDEPCIREFLAQVLSEKYQILFAKNGAEAISIAQAENPLLILLDIVMPGRSGIEVCGELRNNAKTRSIPVLMLTAVNEPEQRTSAFLSGADDYILKPFVPSELLARVESKMRRMSEGKRQSGDLLEFGDLTLNFQEFKAEIAGEPIEIGAIEFKILNCLVKGQGQLVEREALHAFVWGDETPAERALDPHITMLRRRLKSSRGELKTVYGRGYSLVLRERPA